MGGLGLRSNIETSLPAFIGGLELSLPHLTGPDGVCTSLEDIVGNGLLPPSNRWKPLLDSGCRTGQELKMAWQQLQEEDQQCADYLQQEINGPLTSNVEAAGEGSVDGSTRRKIMQHREETSGAVFSQALTQKRNQRCRQVICWRNRDKLSTSWLNCLPGPGGLDNAVFSEGLAMSLCMPSPACREYVGQQVGGRGGVVDIYGDKVMSSGLPGDHWRTRHDNAKMEISSLCAFSKVEHTTEVFGLFSHLIQQEALSRFERGKKRQGLVPDFRIKTTTNTGATRYQLAELKIISCCDSWYAPSAGGKVRAVDKRANRLPTDRLPEKGS